MGNSFMVLHYLIFVLFRKWQIIKFSSASPITKHDPKIVQSEVDFHPGFHFKGSVLTSLFVSFSEFIMILAVFGF